MTRETPEWLARLLNQPPEPDTPTRHTLREQEKREKKEIKWPWFMHNE